ncbi:hypothetical protein FQN50_005394 [Emmonsiellopsis sp. PD_5]|nr:hypothetical protein FQN50_005394 [Emmonsiellopsis sp. PD_5]
MAHYYQATDFLIDRANIHDVLVKMSLYVDTKEWDKMIKEVLLSPGELVIDYTSLFGGEPQKLTAEEITGQWRGLMGLLDASQHVPSAIRIDLPQPGPETAVPQTAFVIAAANATLVKGERYGYNGGRYEIEFKRVSEDPQIGNPWRIAKLKAIITWFAGDRNILESEKVQG